MGKKIGFQQAVFVKLFDNSNIERIGFITRKYSDHLMYSVNFIDDKNEPETLNKASAIWTREKKDISL